MPVYTLRDIKNNLEWDVNMSYADLQKTLDENQHFKHVLKPIKISAVSSKTNLRKAGSGWSDVLGEIKKGSGEDNSVNV